MPFYKDTENKLHFIESEKFEYMLPVGSVPITAAEAEDLQAETPIVEAEQIDPVDKLKSFLASNPDVAELLK